MFVSYAQNFEDVLLWRALGSVERGVYIDVGAQDPVVDSVSLAFFERGWRGIHVEPEPHYAQALREQRSGDVVIEAAVGQGSELVRFYAMPGTGISTTDAEIAEGHRSRGLDIQELLVPRLPLRAVFDACEGPDIHWLKIDVEGAEASVIASWGDEPRLPWVVVVESTLPLSQTESHVSWEPLLLQRGYLAAHFDGLNRYYVSPLHADLVDRLRVPANVFDDFAVNGTASTTLHRLIESRARAELDSSRAEVDSSRAELDSARVELDAARAELHAARAAWSATEAEHAAEQAHATAERLRGDAARVALSEHLAAAEGELRSAVARGASELQAAQNAAAAEADLQAQALHHARRDLQDARASLDRQGDTLAQMAATFAAATARHAADSDASAAKHDAEAQAWRERERSLEASVRSKEAALVAAQKDDEIRLRDRHAAERAWRELLQMKDDVRERELAEHRSAEAAWRERLAQAESECATLLEAQAMLRADIDREGDRSSSLARRHAHALHHIAVVQGHIQREQAAGWRARLFSHSPPFVQFADLEAPATGDPADRGSIDKRNSPAKEGTFMRTPSESPVAVANVQELLLLHDTAFVDSAYRAVLGRSADPGGRASYLAQVRAGIAKEDLLVDMARSDEGRSTSSTLSGLDRLVTTQVAQRPGWLQRLIRRLFGGVRSDMETGFRRLENVMVRMSNSQAGRLESIELQLLRLGDGTGASMASLAGTNASVRATQPDAAVDASTASGGAAHNLTEQQSFVLRRLSEL